MPENKQKILRSKKETENGGTKNRGGTMREKEILTHVDISEN